MKKLFFIALLALFLVLPLPVLAVQLGEIVSPADTMFTRAMLLPGVEKICSASDGDDTESEEEKIASLVSTDTADILNLLNSIAANCKYNEKNYKDSSYEWLFMDMTAYAALSAINSSNFSTEAARQAYIDYAINEAIIATGSEKGGAYAKAVLGLRAAGVNPADLITVNKTKLNAINLLKATMTQNI